MHPMQNGKRKSVHLVHRWKKRKKKGGPMNCYGSEGPPKMGGEAGSDSEPLKVEQLPWRLNNLGFFIKDFFNRNRQPDGYNSNR